MPTMVRRPPLAKAMNDYDPERGEAEIRRFRNMTLKEAIKKAAESRKENGHPYEHQQKNWNFWPDAFEAAMAILSDAEPRFRKCADFDAIHDLVRGLLEDARPATNGLVHCTSTTWLFGSALAVVTPICPKKFTSMRGHSKGRNWSCEGSA